MVDRQRYEFLDGMRGIAAFSVMFMHYSFFENIHILANAASAVDFFFMLSGFVLCHAYAGRAMTLATFMRRRVLRLYPMYLAGFMLGLPWLLLSGGAELPWSMLAMCGLQLVYLPWFGAMPSTFGYTGVASVYPMNVPAWSLFFELFANLFMLALLRRSTRALMAMAALSLVLYLIAGAGLARLFHVHGLLLPAGWSVHDFIGGFPRVAFGLITGIVIWRLLRDGALAGMSAAFARVPGRGALVMLVFVCWLVLPLPRGFGAAIYVTGIVVVAPMLLWCGAQVHWPDGLARRTMVALGELSYPLYCVHVPIRNETQLLAAHMGLSNLAATLLGLFLSVAAASGLLVIYDRPLRAWLARRGRGDSRAMAVA